MSRKNAESFGTKPSRNDRFAQMSRQEQVIEQKKREIQARLQQQQKEKPTAESPTTNNTKPATSVETKKPNKPLWKGNLGNKPNQTVAINKSTSQFNMFSNDGSFLDQFKQQMNDTKKNIFEQKITISSIKSDKVRENNADRNYSNDDRNKPSRWSKSRPQPQSLIHTFMHEEPPIKNKLSRFSDPPPLTDLSQINQMHPTSSIITTFSQPVVTFSTTEIFTNNFTIQPPNLPAPQLINTFSVVTSASPMLVPPPLTIPGIPPPQIVPNNNVGALIAPPPPHTISVPPPVISVTVRQTIAGPPPCGIELTSIPAPNPIPVHTIPQPEPINTLTIPPPAPLQLQNIPSPSPIRLNEIPNPKPIDLLNIPAPGEEPKLNKSMTDPDFIKNVPPPNKSVPPPNLGSVNAELPNISIPPPNTTPTSVPPPLLSHHSMQHVQSGIPSLMAQPVLPPSGMTRVGPPPPPPSLNASQALGTILNVTALPGPPPMLSQPPPLAQTSQIPPMNFPPPLGPPLGVQINVSAPPPGIDENAVCPSGSATHDAMVSLSRMVAQCGSGIEDIVQQRSAQDPSLWFLFHKNSAAYQQYRQHVEQFRAELGSIKQAENCSKTIEYQPEDIYEPDNLTDDEHFDNNSRNASGDPDSNEESENSRKRKRKSRWGEKNPDSPIAVLQMPTQGINSMKSNAMLSKITRTDPGLIQYARNTFGSANLTEEEWKKAEDHYKINLLYQDMVRKREEVERLKKMGKNKYEYDSDEETDGGTWEHKLRMQEMEATQMWANELTRQSTGKHHIGDFLPPDELNKFMEKYSAAKEGRQPNLSDYKEFKLKEDNIGFKMLQKLGWQEGQGLGTEGTGIVEPVNKGAQRDQNQGLGVQVSDAVENNDDEYDAYRKRMMLAYRFRPNPLNNPRRPYY